MRSLREILGALLVAGLAGCSDSGPPMQFTSPSAPATTVSPMPGPDAGGPLAALDACPPRPTPLPGADIAGADLPPGTIVSAVARGRPLTRITGYVPATPVRVREYYQASGLRLLQLEDEIFEAEAFVSNGRTRTYVKVRAVCDRGSSVIAFVAPEPRSSGLPTPGGSPPG